MSERPVKILHVDDNDANRYAVSRSLAKAGFEVTEAATGGEALAKIAEKPDLVILDVRLPDVDGFEVCRRIKADPRTASTPVLHLSASFVSGRDKAYGLDSGADAYLVRPVEPVELIATVNALLRAKRSEEALRQSEERYRLLVENVRDYAIFLTDADGRVTSWNAGAERILGYAEGEIVGKPGATFFTEEDRAAGVPERELATARDEGRALDVRWHLRKDGTRFYADGVMTAVRDDDGRLLGFSKLMRDVTERKVAEDARRALQAQIGRQARLFDATLSSIPDFAYSFDRDGRFLFANKPLADLLGVTPAHMVGKNFFDLGYPEELAGRLQRQIRQVVETGRGLADETPFTSPAGYAGHYEYIFSPVLAADGAVEAVAGTTRDVTARKQEEAERERLRAEAGAARERLVAAFQGSPAFMCVLRGPRHVFEFVNDAYYGLVGRRDLLGKPLVIALPEIEGQGFIDLLDRVYVTGEPFSGKDMPALLHRQPGAAPERRYVEFAFQPLREADGLVSGIFVHGVDTTDRLRNELALRESEARFRQLANAMPQIVWTARPDGWVDYYNDRWYEFTGTARGAAGAETWEPVLHPDDLQRVRETWNASVRAGTLHQDECRFLNPRTGQYRWHLIRAVPVRDVGGAVVKWLGTSTDIEDQKRTEAALRQATEAAESARAAAETANRLKDDFLATLSHELRTPLNAIVGWSTILRGSKIGDADLAEGLETIERNAKVQAQLIEDLLDVSRIISGKLRLDVHPVELPAVIEAAVASVFPAAEAKGIRVQRVLDPCGTLVLADPARVQQIVWNLLSNAIKFTPRGGRVEVGLARVDMHVEIVVTDTGAGMAADFVPHVFERFRQADASTTRRHGGLGLGLAIVRHLVELHGGTVHAASPGEGRGSTFTVSLPVRQAAYPEGRGAPPAGAPRKTAECDSALEGVRVLVVDDEADARNLVRRMLEDCRAVVTVAASAAEAMAFCRQGRFDVLVSDIGMPSEDGYDLIRQIRALPPEAGGTMPAVALTAFARAEDRQRALRAGFQVHVPKPVDPAEFLALVASAAGRSRRPG